MNFECMFSESCHNLSFEQGLSCSAGKNRKVQFGRICAVHSFFFFCLLLDRKNSAAAHSLLKSCFHESSICEETKNLQQRVRPKQLE